IGNVRGQRTAAVQVSTVKVVGADDDGSAIEGGRQRSFGERVRGAAGLQGAVAARGRTLQYLEAFDVGGVAQGVESEVAEAVAKGEDACIESADIRAEVLGAAVAELARHGRHVVERFAERSEAAILDEFAGDDVDG